MEGPVEQRFDLSAAKATALELAREWGLQLGEPFALSNVSYVAPAVDRDQGFLFTARHRRQDQGTGRASIIISRRINWTKPRSLATA